MIGYLLTYLPHAPRLVVSLNTLRRHYDGKVVIFVTQDDSLEIANKIASDSLLNVNVIKYKHSRYGRNSTYITKVELYNDRDSGADETTLYLDADTTIHGDVTPLIHAADQSQVCVSNFAGWKTTQGVVRKRMEKWFGVNGLADIDLRNAISDKLSAVNTGVLAIRHDATILKPWLALATAGYRNFIPDEISFQILIHYHQREIVDDRYNFSPLYGINSPPVIRHYHGDKHLLKCSHGTWFPEFMECFRNNVGGICSWWDKCGDTELNTYYEKQAHET